MHALIQRRWVVSILIGSCCFAFVAGARLATLLEPLELIAYDWLIRLRADVRPSKRVVVVGVSEDDIRRLETWSVPHGVLATALDKLLALDPVAVGLDIHLDVPVPPGRPALDKLLSNDKRVISVMKLGDAGSTRIEPASVHLNTDQVGFTDVLLDPDAKVRRGLLFLDSDGNFLLSFALQMAVRYLTPQGLGPAPDSQEPSHMRLGSVTFVPFEGSDGSYQGADAGGYQFIVDYRERPGAFGRLNLFDVLDGKATRE